MDKNTLCELPTRGSPKSPWLLVAAVSFALSAQTGFASSAASTHTDLVEVKSAAPASPNASNDTEDLDRSTPSAIEKLSAWPAVSVNVNRAAGIYVARAKNTLYFWAVDEVNGHIEHLAQLPINPSAGQDIIIDLGSDATGLVYADNLFQPGEQLRFIFRGKLQKAKIAIPMAESHFKPLFSVFQFGQVVVVGASQPGLQGIVNTQVDIYAISDHVDAMQDHAAGQFANQTQGQLINATSALTANNTAMVSQIDAAQLSTLNLQSQFTQQLNTDQAIFTATLNEAQGFVSSELNNMATVVIPCAQTAQANVQTDVDSLQVRYLIRLVRQAANMVAWQPALIPLATL
jgi:hypothetical protein